MQVSPNKPLVPTRNGEAPCSRHSVGVGLEPLVRILNATEEQADAWLKLRHALWPEVSLGEHQAEIESFLSGTAREPQAVLLAEDDDGQIVGFAELSIRSYAEGCSSDQVDFLEGWYVSPEFRRRGIGKALVAAAERWGVAQDCTEFASDTQSDNEKRARP